MSKELEPQTSSSVSHIRDAVLVQALWSEQAGINQDIFSSQENQESATVSQESLKQLAVNKMEEWCELVVSLFDPTAHQAARLLELADMQGYTNHYVGYILRRDAQEKPTFSRDAARVVNARSATDLLKSSEHPLPDKKTYSDQELRKILDLVKQLGIRHMAEHFEFIGFHPNGSHIAEIKMAQVENSVTDAVNRIRDAAESGTADKAFLKTVAREMFSFAEHLPQIIRPDVGIEFLVPMYESLDIASKEIFSYGMLSSLTQSMYVRQYMVVPEVSRPVLVAGKNSRNYPPINALPPGWTYRQVREVRNHFPDSILPPDFVLGRDTPQEYLKRKQPQGSPAEIRRFESNDLR